MTKNNPPVLLIDAFSDWDDGKGIFSEMDNMPWDEEVTADLLDLDYFGNHSGWKKCAPLVYHLMSSDYTLTNTARKKLADLVVAKFKPNWDALWETYHSSYSIMQDYDITETGNSAGSENRSKTIGHQGSDSKTESSNTTKGHSGSNSTTESSNLIHGHVISDAESNTVEEDNGRYGFNSAEVSPTDKREGSSSGQKISTNSGTDTTQNLSSNEDSYSDTGSLQSIVSNQDSSTDTHSEANQKADNYTKTVSGLRGNFTRQQILLQERELWIEDFFTRVYLDIDSVLASMIYNREHQVRHPYIWGYGYYSI